MLNEPWHRQSKWKVNPLNYHPEVVEGFNLPPDRRVFVVDSTLRSICTSEPGTAVTPDDLVEIAHALEGIGVRETVFNISHTGSISDLAFRGAQAVKNSGLKRLLVTSGCGLTPNEWKEGLDKAMEAGVDCLEVSYGANLVQGFSGTPRVFEWMERAVEYSVSNGYPTSVAFNVRPGTDLDFFLEYFRRSLEFEPRFFRIYNPKTCLAPEAMRWLVRKLKTHLGNGCPPVVIHTHNSWGLATATTVAGVLGGAAGVDTAVIGVGTKCGHTPFEETVMALEALHGIDTGIKLEGMYELARLVERVINVPVHPNSAIVGKNAFLCEQAPAVVEALRERITGEPALTPYAAHTVGQKKRVVWGKNTVKPAVLMVKLEEMGIEPSEDNVRRAVDAVNAEVARLDSYPAWLEDEQAEAIIRSLKLRQKGG